MSPRINVGLSYTGTVSDPQGCGLKETLQSTGLAVCNPDTQLYLNGDGTFELNLGCDHVPVAHAFSWLGPCGALFEYPVDGEPVTDVGWQVQDVAFGAMPRTTFALPAQGTALSGSDMGASTGHLSYLFTSLATGESGPVDYSFTFTLIPAVEEELTLELESPKYDRWRPNATETGNAGEPLPVTARLKSSTGRDPSVRVTDFIWKLTDTSREPGVLMNWPLDASDTELDMRLGTPGDTHTFDADRQQGERFSPSGFTDTMDVVPYDWGGWSTLTVTAVLSDGRRIVGKWPAASDAGGRLPKRSATSLISDFWKQSHGAGGKPDSADDEAVPLGDKTPGDGLNLYQEYRGFRVGGAQDEGDPLVKDFFLLNRAQGAATAGIAKFKRLSKLNVHYLLHETDIPSSRVINGNHGAAPAGTPQHAVIVAIDDKLQGLSRAEGGPGNPGKISWVRLQGDWQTVKANAWSTLVAHELFHCVNVAHHGETDLQKVLWRVEEPDQLIEERGGPGTGTQITFRQEEGADYTADAIAWLSDPKKKDELPLGMRLVWIGVDQGQHSGDGYCVMRYFNGNAYVSKADPTVRFDATDYPGGALCSSPTGTGVNVTPRVPQSRYGAAAAGRGNCEQQVHVTDGVPAPAH